MSTGTRWAAVEACLEVTKELVAILGSAVALTLLLLVAFAMPCRAQEPETDEAASLRLLDEGRLACAAAVSHEVPRCERAVYTLRESVRRLPTTWNVCALARCLFECKQQAPAALSALEDCQENAAATLQALQSAPASADAARADELQVFASDAIRSQLSGSAHITIELRPHTADVKVLLDSVALEHEDFVRDRAGKRQPRDAAGEPFFAGFVWPGEHQLEVQGASYNTERRSFEAVAERPLELSLELTQRVGASTPAARPAIETSSGHIPIGNFAMLGGSVSLGLDRGPAETFNDLSRST